MRLSIRFKIIAALVPGLVLIAVATAVLMRFVHARAVSLAAQREVATAASALADLEKLEIERMSALLEVLVANDRLADALARRDRRALLAMAEPVFEALRAKHGVTHWYFHLPEPEDGVFLRVHRPEMWGDAVRREAVTRSARELREVSGRELGRTAFAVRVVRPLFRGGELVGFVELGEDVPTLLSRMKALRGDDYGMLLAKSRLDRTAWGALTRDRDRWDSRPELVAVETTTGDDAMLGGIGRLADVPAAPTIVSENEANGRATVRGVFPLVEAGEKIGAVVVVHDVSALHDGVRDVRLRVVVVVALLAAGLAALVIFLLETLVFERLARMSRAVEELPERLARGDYGAGTDDVGPTHDDEIGRFEAFLGRALREVGSFVVDVRRERRRTRSTDDRG